MKEKKQNNKIYLVSEGDYSEYCIIGIFDSKYKAQKLINHLKGQKYLEPYIEIYELNKLDYGRKKPFSVNMLKNGDVLDCNPVREYTAELKINCPYWTKDQIMTLSCNVLAKNSEHAIKIVNEKRSILIAQNLFKIEYSENKKEEDY